MTARGEKIVGSKLTAEKVLEIRDKYKPFDVAEERKVKPEEYGVYAIWAKKKEETNAIPKFIVMFRPGFIYQKISNPVSREIPSLTKDKN